MAVSRRDANACGINVYSEFLSLLASAEEENRIVTVGNEEATNTGEEREAELSGGGGDSRLHFDGSLLRKWNSVGKTRPPPP